PNDGARGRPGCSATAAGAGLRAAAGLGLAAERFLQQVGVGLARLHNVGNGEAADAAGSARRAARSPASAAKAAAAPAPARRQQQAGRIIDIEIGAVAIRDRAAR